MLKRGRGKRPGRSESIDRGDVLTRIRESLQDLEFPMQSDALLEKARDIPWVETPKGEQWSLADALEGAPVTEYSSAGHVAEVVRLRWEDMADILRPGGPGPHDPYSPDADRRVRSHTAENAMEGGAERRGERG